MKKSYILPILLLLTACASTKNIATGNAISIANGGKAWASIWQQRAAEYKALCFQAYNIAKLRVDEGIKNPGSKPWAIVTDIDETLLDNSPYDASRALQNLDYTDATWKGWTDKAIADTVPGAPAFFKYAASKGITIFYITNRNEGERATTLKNLQLYGLPNADNDMLYDNHPSEESRVATTRKLEKEFGSRYIVIPNPSYGDFEGALFRFNYKLTNAQKDSVIKANIKTDK
jgi:5'-nucleotidase (lipoprotein e(P4) family)